MTSEFFLLKFSSHRNLGHWDTGTNLMLFVKILLIGGEFHMNTM